MVGRTISHYEILEKLGAGGMGEIYKAQDTRLNRMVAVKVLSATQSGAAGRRRFTQEAMAASALNHPNIITIHDIVSQDDGEFMVMEFVAGKTLSDLIPQSGLGVRDTLRYGVQIADALQAAHAAGIIHRDLKPGNVMVTDAGLVKVLDFGLAKFTGPAPVSLSDNTQTIADAPLTVEGSIIGTVSYMSPEQAQGKKIDQRSDIFSFGILLYEMLTGHRAFNADSALSTLTAILRDEVRPIAEIVREVPPEFEQLVGRALRKNPDDRWQNMQEVLQALSSLKLRSDSGTLDATQILIPPARRSRTGLLVAAACILVASAAGAWWWAAHRTAAPRTVPAPAAAVPATTLPAVDAPPPSPFAAKTPADGALTNQSIIDMVKAKVPVPIIAGQIRASKTRFDLSTPEVIRLSQAGVTEEVIEAMRHPKGVPPAATVIPSAPVPSVPAAIPPAKPPVLAAPRTIEIPDGLPFNITLLEDVSADLRPGQLLRFAAASDFRVGDAVVIAKGAAVAGAIMEPGRRRFLKDAKATFRLILADAVDGSKLKVRATPARGEGKIDRPLEIPNRQRPKDLSAAAGTEYVAYTAGRQSVTLR